jgi:hypothetical protein
MESLNCFKPHVKKKPKRFYEKTYVFQDTWACHFPSAELVIRDDGLVSQVRCTICSKIFKKPKLAFKLDMLQKHVGCQKAIILSLGGAIGDWYYCNDATNYKNERALIGRNSKTIMTLVQSRIHFGA